MSGRADSEPDEVQGEVQGEEPDEVQGEVQGEEPDEEPDAGEALWEVRRARWAAVGTGALLTLAGLAASVLRSTGSAPALVPVAYALGAAVCALAALLGFRGHTRRALWLLVAGAMVMAFGDQFD